MESVASKRGKKLGDISSLFNKSEAPAPVVGKSESTNELDVSLLRPGKYQPRKHFNENALQELAESIKAQGVMQPIVVRPVEGGQFEIVAGERRWRATKLAGLETIPAIVRDINDQTAMAMALIENIQREDLSPIESATALQSLKDEFSLTSKEVASAVGKSEKEVSELLTLLKLPEPLLRLMERGTESPQILGVLNRCYKLDSEATASFVANKSAITYDDANAFQKYLKERDKDPVGQSTEPSPSSSNAQGDGREGAEEEDGQGEDVNVKQKGAEAPSQEPAQVPGSTEDELGYILDNKNFVVAVEYQGQEWMLELTRKDNDAEFCWIKRGADFQRVLARDLTLVAVQ